MDQRKRKASETEAREDEAREQAAGDTATEATGAEGEVEPAEGQGRKEPEVVEPEVIEPEAAAQAEPEEAEPEVVEPEATEADRLREQLAQLQGRLRTVSKAYTDLQHEMKAFRERQESHLKIREERQRFDAVKGFFDPVMNLKRSIGSHGGDMEALLEGLRMVHHQFMSSLESLGLEKVPGEGAPFDPNLHEALAVTPVTDPEQDGKVLMVHADGYAVNGKVLQAAQVVIGKYQAPQGEA